MDFSEYDELVKQRKQLQWSLVKALHKNIDNNLKDLQAMRARCNDILDKYFTPNVKSQSGIVLFKDNELKHLGGGISDGILSLDITTGTLQLYMASADEVQKENDVANTLGESPLYIKEPTDIDDHDILGALSREDHFELAMFATTPKRLLAEAMDTEQQNINTFKEKIGKLSTD